MTKNFKRIVSKKTVLRMQPVLIQHWVETGDERCPLGGMWTAMTVSQSGSTDEDDLRWRILPDFARGCAVPTYQRAA